jgi:hypothetical protein
MEKRPGRPRVGDRRVGVIMTREQVADLHEISLVEGVSLAAICRRALAAEIRRVKRGRRDQVA